MAVFDGEGTDVGLEGGDGGAVVAEVCFCCVEVGFQGMVFAVEDLVRFLEEAFAFAHGGEVGGGDVRVVVGVVPVEVREVREVVVVMLAVVGVSSDDLHGISVAVRLDDDSAAWHVVVVFGGFVFLGFGWGFGDGDFDAHWTGKM